MTDKMPAEFRAEIADILYEKWWQDSQPPNAAPPNWSIGRDLSIVKKLVAQGWDKDELVDALELYEGNPATLAIFYKRGYRNLLHKLAHKARQRRDSATPHVSEGLKDFARQILDTDAA